MTKTKLISSNDLYWIAGILEGEGSFTLAGSASNRQPKLSLNMTDRDIISRVAYIIGGRCTVVARKPNASNQKPIYLFQACSYLAVEWMRLLYPIMGSRRQQQIKICLDLWNSRKRNRPDSSTILPIMEVTQNEKSQVN